MEDKTSGIYAPFGSGNVSQLLERIGEEMNPLLIVLSFTAVAIMRVIQKVCSKKVSGEVGGKKFFHYGGYYNLMSALFSLVTFAFVGFNGFDLPTVLCALGTAVLMAVELFASIEAVPLLSAKCSAWGRCLFLASSGFCRTSR